MPIVRNFQSVEISVGQGGRLMPDVPISKVGLANYVTKENWRRVGVGDDAEEVKREGWDWFRPNASESITNQKTIAASSVLKIGEARRPNGKTVPVACCANGKIYWYSYDGYQWTEIGSGYSSPPTGYQWQIENVGSYVVFNNAIDLPFTWLIGDVAVSPIHELRERGVASVGNIWESNQILCCADILEIKAADLSGIMNGGTPYGQVTDASKVTRWQFRKIWSNNGDPRDFAATVNGTISAASSSLSLAWPMASLTNGTEILVEGAGTDGGNLTATISSGGGTVTLTLSTPAVTTATLQPVLRATALNSIVGSYDFDNDGAAVLRGKKLQNRSVVYKSTSIFVGYYTGDIDEPWVYEHVYTGKRTPRFRWTLVDVGGGYHLYAGDEHFYRFKLGTQEPTLDPVITDCEGALFFDLVGDSTQSGGVATEGEVSAADNGCTNEIFFLFRYGTTYRILAYNYLWNCCDVITTGSAAFLCCATLHKPTAVATASERELWFVFGDSTGGVTQYGSTNLAVVTPLRYGAVFASTWRTGYGDFGDGFNEKDVRNWVLVNSGPGASVGTTFNLYAADRTNQTLTLLESKTVTDSSTPGLVPLHYRRMYFSEGIETYANAEVRISGRIWEVARIKDRSITRSAT